MKRLLTLFSLLAVLYLPVFSQDLPDTGISGLYEVFLAVEDAREAQRYFADFGFRVVDSTRLTADQAYKIYGVRSGLTSYRLQNGDIDSHGLLRLWVWDNPLGPGVGYAEPETIGQRMSVMRTDDIVRLYDIYEAARSDGQPWLPTFPIADDLFDLDGGKKRSFFDRPVQVRENCVYGKFFNHVFFQRYGYHIPGYGTVEADTPLKTSEFTHHDFIIQVENMSVLEYLSKALGLKAENPPSIDGEWQKGPRTVFMMTPGYSHWYQGFVSPNNICGKLKFFMPRGPKPDRSANQRPGELGITMHSFYTPKLGMVRENLLNVGISTSAVQTNEFGERSFVFTGPEGATWQIIEQGEIKHKPLTKLDFQLVNE